MLYLSLKGITSFASMFAIYVMYFAMIKNQSEI